MPLQEYRLKRDFSKTREPKAGRFAAASKKAPIFVVQEHHASHLHYDFRLEAFGALKSWAVPKGPSLKVGEKRLAVEVEDHPLSYATFAGTIPKGQYGGGVVKIWDKGTWQVARDQHLKEALKKGHLEFELHGEKLTGKWLLQRIRQEKNGKNQWLLIKRSEEARVEKPPEELSPQLCLLVDRAPEGSDWIYETKLDGYRTLGFIENGDVRLLTRNGLDWSEKYLAIREGLKKIRAKSAVLDGEVVALGKDHISDFSGLQRALSENRVNDLAYMVFDILFMNGKDLRSRPLEERKKILKKLLSHSKLPKRIAFSVHVQGQDGKQVGRSLFEAACKNDQEGIIAKDRNSTYEGTRGSAWQKIKCSKRQEFVIGGYTEPEGEREVLGALLLGTYEKGKLRYVGKVGTGFNRQKLHELEKSTKNLGIDHSPFSSSISGVGRVHWLSPKLVAEIEFKAWTSDRCLRHSVYMGLREDKKVADVTLEVPITHPERVVYKFGKHEITKGDVAAYYQEVATLLLKQAAMRPLAFLRCPTKAGESCFYQKHMDLSKLPGLHGGTVMEQSVNYIQDQGGLAQLVQWGVLELHAWQCHMDHPENPDQIVFDLDPGDRVPWRKVAEGALKLKAVLDKLSLESYLKTTGGKGLHIHVPIAPIYGWQQVKSFSRAIAQMLEEQYPNEFTANLMKNKRYRKIFIDYLRNGYGATAVVPYSLRARQVPSVALPIAWKELKRLKGPVDFQLSSALKRIARRKTDPWHGIDKLKQKIKLFA